MQKKNIILKKNDLAKNPCVLLFDKGDLGKNIILFFHTDSTKHSFASISTAISQFTWKNGTGIVVMNFFFTNEELSIRRENDNYSSNLLEI